MIAGQFAHVPAELIVQFRVDVARWIAASPSWPAARRIRSVWVFRPPRSRATARYWRSSCLNHARPHQSYTRFPRPAA